MSRLQKMSIRGIRSFSPYEEIKIEFFRPLTLIQGHNGCGKTVRIKKIILNYLLLIPLDYNRMSKNGHGGVTPASIFQWKNIHK